MREVIFYEKPGCVTNAKQKKALVDAGCIVIKRNLLEHGLNAEELRAFLRKKPVHEWFNPNAPMVKNGEVDPTALSELSALEMLMNNPILIRRPLIEIDGKKMCGFDARWIETTINGSLVSQPDERCSNTAHECN